MAVFNTPERYGRGLDWTGYTVHDAANLLRRYLNQLPEPIIPLAMYPRFREPLRHHQAQAVGPMEQQLETHGDFDPSATIRIFQQFITELPPLNRQLLLYILDLLAVFASKSDNNRMTAPNLSAIFQPGILRHPDHDMAPAEYRLSQDVVIFLIEHQDHFVIGLPGTAADEQTIHDVQSAPKPSATPTTPRSRTQQLVGRSASSASAGSESLRRYGDIRRHASTNSRGSRQSQHTSSPATPPAASPMIPGSKGSGVHRSNTVPSKKSPSPALSASERFQRLTPADSLATNNAVAPATPSPAPAPTAQSPAGPADNSPSLQAQAPYTSKSTSSPHRSPHRSPLLKPFAGSPSGRSTSQDRQVSVSELLAPEGGSLSGRASPVGTPGRERGISSLWKQSPSDSEGRRYNKLQKKRPPGEMNAQGSQQSLGGGSLPTSPALVPTTATVEAHASNEGLQATPPMRPGFSTANSFQTAREQATSSDPGASPSAVERDPSAGTLRPDQMALKDLPQRHSATTVKAREASPARSSNSRSTGAEASSLSTGEEAEGVESGSKEKKHHRWRISTSAKKDEERNHSQSTPSHSNLGSSVGAEGSTSTGGGNGMLRKSDTDESNARGASSSEADDRAISPRRGLSGWFKGKMQERHERKEERERAKSPPPPMPLPPAASDEPALTRSLSAIAASEAAPASPRQQQAAVVAPTPELQGLSETLAQVELPVADGPAPITTQGLGAAEVDSSDAVTPKAPVQPMSTVATSEAAPTTEINTIRETEEESKS